MRVCVCMSRNLCTCTSNNLSSVSSRREDATNPCFWSRVCLHNMAKLAKEATTIRRVLESLFRYFDTGNSWSPENGLAFPVLKDMQFLMDSSGNLFKIDIQDFQLPLIVITITPKFLIKFLYYPT